MDIPGDVGDRFNMMFRQAAFGPVTRTDVVVPPNGTLVRVKMRPPEWRSKKAIPVMLIDEVSPEPGDEFIALLGWNRNSLQTVTPLSPVELGRAYARRSG